MKMKNLNELYDLENDPRELENIYGRDEVASVQNILSRRLCKWEEDVGATRADLLK